MNWPGRAACATSIARSSATNSVCSTMTTASAPRGITPPVAIGVAVPGPTDRAGATPQARISRLRARRRGLAGAGALGVARAQGEAVHQRPVEGRHVDGRGDVAARARGRAPRRASPFWRQGDVRNGGAEARDAVLPADHRQELLLPRGLRRAGRRRRVRVRSQRQDLDLAPLRIPLRLRIHQNRAVRLDQAAPGEDRDRRAAEARRAPAHEDDLAEPDGRDDLAQRAAPARGTFRRAPASAAISGRPRVRNAASAASGRPGSSRTGRPSLAEAARSRRA